MKWYSSVTLCIAVTWTISASPSPFFNLYTDHRAMQVDDILTVVVIEQAKAGTESGTQTKKRNSLGASSGGGSGALGFLPSFGASAGTDVGYDGKGSTEREGSLVAKVSAKVIEVLDNGNLVIDGSKEVEINAEREVIKVSGIVRPQDIESENIVYSYNIADARISYAGKGTANQGQRPGILARVLNFIF